MEIVMAAARAEHRAALLQNGRVLVVGGYDESVGSLASAEVYDPAIDRWQSLDPMPEPRHGIFAGVIGNIIYIPGGGTRQGLGATKAFRVRP